MLYFMYVNVGSATVKFVLSHETHRPILCNLRQSIVIDGDEFCAIVLAVSFVSMSKREI